MGKPIDAFGPPIPSAPGDVGRQGNSGAAANAEHVHDRSAEHGSGITQTYVGYNNIGAATEALNDLIVKAKQITLATAGMLNSIDLYLKDSGGGQVGGMTVMVFDDNANTIGNLIAMGTHKPTDSIYMNTAARWVSFSLGKWLTAATYWIGFQMSDGNGSSLLIGLDTTGGSDRTYTPGGAWIADGDRYAQTGTTKKYSLRGSILS